MKKIIFRFNYVFLFAIALMFCVQAQAQIPKIDGKDGGKIDVSGGRMNPKLKKAIADKAAIDKILNATVSKVEFEMSKIPAHIKNNAYMSGTVSVYADRKISLKENNNGDFALKENFTDKPVVTKKSGELYLFNETHSFTPGTTTRYKDLLSNGFTVNVDLTKRHTPEPVFKCNFLLIFYFTDGTKVAVALQDIITANLSKEGSNVFLKDVHVSKNFPGSVFPDPENPLVLPPVK